MIFFIDETKIKIVISTIKRKNYNQNPIFINFIKFNSIFDLVQFKDLFYFHQI